MKTFSVFPVPSDPQPCGVNGIVHQGGLCDLGGDGFQSSRGWLLQVSWLRPLGCEQEPDNELRNPGLQTDTQPCCPRADQASRPLTEQPVSVTALSCPLEERQLC